MNRVEIKKRAKDLAHEKLKDFWIGFGITLLISMLCSFIISLLFKEGTVLNSALTIISSFFTTTISVGFYSYILKIVRKEDYQKEELFAFVPNIMQIAVLSFLMTLIIVLWMFLLIVPGIIAALAYSMALYIFVDNKDMLPMEILNKSKSMMNGYKMDFFVFKLSFFGWILLSCLTFGILFIWVMPYITFAEIIYYEELKKQEISKK